MNTMLPISAVRFLFVRYHLQLFLIGKIVAHVLLQHHTICNDYTIEYYSRTMEPCSRCEYSIPKVNILKARKVIATLMLSLHDAVRPIMRRFTLYTSLEVYKICQRYANYLCYIV